MPYEKTIEQRYTKRFNFAGPGAFIAYPDLIDPEWSFIEESSDSITFEISWVDVPDGETEDFLLP